MEREPSPSLRPVQVPCDIPSAYSANFVDDCPAPGTGSYYYDDPTQVGLIPTEDLVVMLDEMGKSTGWTWTRSSRPAE